MASKQSFEDTYPGEMLIISRFETKGQIINCEGLGEAQPFGWLVKTNSEWPNRVGFPRLNHLPSRIVMRWKTSNNLVPNQDDPSDVKYHSQIVEFPKNLKGRRGSLLFLLDENNHWSVSLRDEQDWKKIIKTD